MIKVGEFIRTEDEILQVEAIGDNFIKFRNYTCSDDLESFLKPNYKHSHNIIDLIEVGDYVNGHLVVGFNEEVDINGYKYKEIEIESDHLINHYLKLEDIQTIVTHEQMKSIEYRVGGEDECN